MPQQRVRIIIPYINSGLGGPSTFVQYVRQHFSEHGYQVIHNWHPRAAAMLVIAECPLWLALLAKLNGIRIIQRLDNVYHPALPAWRGHLHRLSNLRMRILHTYLADHVVYQSKFARHTCQTFFGQPHSSTSIIYNGVRIPKSTNLVGASEHIKLVTAGSFRRRDQIMPIINSLNYLEVPYELHILGPNHPRLNKLFATLTKTSHTKLHGPMQHKRMLAVLSHFDMFLFSDQSACPNVVIESLAAGVPVVAFDRGAIPELIQNDRTGRVVPLPPHKPFADAYPFSENAYRDFAEAITTVANDLASYRRNAAAHAAAKYDITRILPQYENLLR